MMVPDFFAAAGGGGGFGSGSGSSCFPATVVPVATEELTGASVTEKEKKIVDISEFGTVELEKISAAPDSCRGGGGGNVGHVDGDVSPLSCLSSVKKTEIDAGEEAAVIVRIKEEEDDEAIYEENGADGFDGCDGGVDCNGSPSSSSSVVLPRPMECLNDSGPPPFLRKTFEMVEDPVTDSIVSWSETRDSFVVWDSHEFSKHLLPKYFKHSNFSSFIRQLNTYGFRKIDPDRWEFANEGFRGGKKHLLKNIKRRSRYNNKHHHQGGTANVTGQQRLEGQLEDLQSDQDLMRVEILKLRQQQEDSHNRMSAVEERIRAAECKQLQMFIFFSKATKNPAFIQQLIHKRKRQGELAGAEFVKKRRLLHGTQFPESLPDALDNSQSVDCRNQAQEKLATMQSEITQTLPETIEASPISTLFETPISDDGFCSSIDQDDRAMCGAGTQEMPAVYNLMSEKLLDDNSLAVNPVNEDNLDVNDSKFYLELEDLVGQPRTWSGYMSEPVEQA